MKDGVFVLPLGTWAAFHLFLGTEMLEYPNYIYRGHTRSDWPLEPSLDRALRRIGKLTDPQARAEHLERFKFATRGRRGPSPPQLSGENEWWALGQHHGLATPLLDWTHSPYVAAFFAFAEVDDTSPGRAVYALQTGAVEESSVKIAKSYAGTDRPPTIEIFRPLSNENARLVNQGGLFTRGPDGVDVEQWVQQQYPGEAKIWRLIKFVLPNSERDTFLKHLNRMNINHLSLFPDLLGASAHTNLELSIKHYGFYSG